MTICELLERAGMEAGIAAILGFVLSYLVEWWPRFELLPPRIKRLLIMALSAVVIPGIIIGLQYALGCEIELTLDALRIVATGAVAYAASQVAHVRKL